MPDIGIITGSGFDETEGIVWKESKKVSTPYGEPSDAYRICEISGIEVAFLARHGRSHHIQPHRINYRANLWGFKQLGVERLFSVGAVGGINPSLMPGDIIIPGQIIDMTCGRVSTFFEGDEVVHIDFTSPFCTDLRAVLFQAGKQSSVSLKGGATYICVNGPRLETKAEIRFFSLIGADVVGMTAMPEASLARELELCIANIAVVTNYAAGISQRSLTVIEVIEVMRNTNVPISLLLSNSLQVMPHERTCECMSALRNARI
jgi:5'-methylthioinosine phosphorylase